MILPAHLSIPRRAGLTKTMRIMKLTAIILLLGFLHVSASGRAQTVTYSAKEAPLNKVLAAIEQQTGYNIYYDEADLKESLPVTVQLQLHRIPEALKQEIWVTLTRR